MRFGPAAITRASCILLVAAGCSSAPPVDRAEFWAGTAAVDLTPPRATPLGGYSGRRGQPMTGVYDPVRAKALWLETPETRLCLVVTDLVGSLRAVRDRIRPEGASMVLAATHNHSGPGALARGFWQAATGPFDADWYEEVVRRISRAVAEARASKRPARLAFARGVEPALARNRRTPGGPVDPEVNVLVVSDEISRPIAILVNYGAHATALPEGNMLMSADWPGALQMILEDRLGAVVLFTQGASGDVSPNPPSGRDDFERCSAMGEALAGRVEDIVKGIEKREERVRISYVERGVDLPDPTLPLAPSKSVLGMIEINGTRMFCFPGEPSAELGLALKKRFPGAWILGLSNDHLGYFLGEEEYRKGGYERNMSFYGPRMGPWLVDQFTQLGERGHAEDRAAQPEGGSGQDDHRRQPGVGAGAP